MANNTITSEDLEKAWMFDQAPMLLSEEDKALAKKTMKKVVTVEDVIGLINRPMAGMQTQYNRVAKEVDDIDYVLNHFLHITEAQWETASAENDKTNKAQIAKLQKEMKAKADAYMGETPASKSKVVPLTKRDTTND